MSKYILIFLLGCLFIGFFSNCNKGPETTLSRDQEIWVDTLFNRMIKQIDAEADSICSRESKYLFDMAVDSIKQVRIIEIEKILGSQ